MTVSDEQAMSMLESIRRNRDLNIARLQKQADAECAAAEEKIDEALELYGKVRCKNCNGTGAVERLDSGYIRKFGLREWDGCTHCGSTDRELKGRGFVDK